MSKIKFLTLNFKYYMYICIMVLDKEQIKALKIKLALEGTGAKSRLANKLNLFESQITLILAGGKIPEHCKKKLEKWLNEK